MKFLHQAELFWSTTRREAFTITVLKARKKEKEKMMRKKKRGGTAETNDLDCLLFTLLP